MLSIRNDILAYLVVSCIFVRQRKDINYGKFRLVFVLSNRKFVEILNSITLSI